MFAQYRPVQVKGGIGRRARPRTSSSHKSYSSQSAVSGSLPAVDPATLRAATDKLALQLGFDKKDDWYRLQSKDLKSNSTRLGISKLLDSINYSPQKFLALTFPNETWQPWLSPAGIPHGYWEDLHSQRAYFAWLAETLHYTKDEDWYKLTAMELKKQHGASLVAKYKSSVVSFLRAVRPDHRWLEWKFANVPKYWWQDIKNQREFLEWLGQQLGYKAWDDWYHLSASHIDSQGGRTLLNFYGKSTPVLVMTVLAEKSAKEGHQWMPWKFRQTPKLTWANGEAVSAYIDWLGHELAVTTLDGWYSITPAQIAKFKGQALTRAGEGNLVELLARAYPDHPWRPWQFKVIPQSWWEDISNQRRFMEYAEKTLGIGGDLEKWYSFTVRQIMAIGGTGIVIYYAYQLKSLLEGVYPQHEWDEFRFPKTSPEFWRTLSPEKVRRFMDHLGDAIGVYDPSSPAALERWYEFDLKTLEGSKRVARALKRMGGLPNALNTAYPNHKWDFKLLSQPRAPEKSKAIQRSIIASLDKLIPSKSIARRRSKKFPEEIPPTKPPTNG